MEVIKSRNSNVSTSFARSESKKKIGYSSVMNFKKVGSTNIVSSSSPKITKQIRGSGSKMFKENSIIETGYLKDKKAG